VLWASAPAGGGHAQDLTDVREMLARGLVDRGELRERFAQIEAQLYRSPAIVPGSFRSAVERAAAGPAIPNA